MEYSSFHRMQIFSLSIIKFLCFLKAAGTGIRNGGVKFDENGAARIENGLLKFYLI